MTNPYISPKSKLDTKNTYQELKFKCFKAALISSFLGSLIIHAVFIFYVDASGDVNKIPGILLLFIPVFIVSFVVTLIYGSFAYVLCKLYFGHKVLTYILFGLTPGLLTTVAGLLNGREGLIYSGGTLLVYGFCLSVLYGLYIKNNTNQ